MTTKSINQRISDNLSSDNQKVKINYSASEVSESKAKDFFQLLKPRVMSLVIFTATIGIVRAPDTLHPFLLGLSVICIAIAAGSSGGLNMWYERHIDKKMRRTSSRPIPSGKINPGEALTFSLILSAGSIFLMGLALNWAAAAWLVFTILFYIIIYTMWLKPRTDQNIVIGGISGALPPLIGWVAVTGQVTLESFLLFLIIFLWTPPHFWALAMVYGQDYKKVNLPMLPYTKGRSRAALESFLYTIFVVSTSISFYFLGFAGQIYLIGAIILGGSFIYKSIELFRFPNNNKKAKQLFSFSIVYLFGLFSLLGLESFL